MENITEKLKSEGVPSSIISTLKKRLGSKFESDLISKGLISTAYKLGVDTTNLPDINFKDAYTGVQELMGKDVDGDGKTGFSEAVDSFKKATANTDMNQLKNFASKNAGGVFTKIKGLFGAK